MGDAFSSGAVTRTMRVGGVTPITPSRPRSIVHVHSETEDYMYKRTPVLTLVHRRRTLISVLLHYPTIYSVDIHHIHEHPSVTRLIDPVKVTSAELVIIRSFITLEVKRLMGY